MPSRPIISLSGRGSRGSGLPISGIGVRLVIGAPVALAHLCAIKLVGKRACLLKSDALGFMAARRIVFEQPVRGLVGSHNLEPDAVVAPLAEMNCVADHLLGLL